MCALAGVDERVRRVEPQPVESIVRNPRHRVVDDEAPHGLRARPIQVDAAAPRGVVVDGHVRRIELHQIRAFGAEVVVDDVEDDGDVQPVGGIDEGAQIVGPAVVSRRRIQADAVVAPVAGAGEFRDRHQLDGRDAEVVQLAEPLTRRREGALRREGPDVQLVEGQLACRPHSPPLMLPAEGVRVDDCRRSVNAVWLEARRGIRPRVGAVDRIDVTIASARAPDEAGLRVVPAAARAGRCRPRRRSTAAAAAGARAAPAPGSGRRPAPAAHRSARRARCRPWCARPRLLSMSANPVTPIHPVLRRAPGAATCCR